MKIVTIAEQKDGKLSKPSLEAVTAAKILGDDVTTVVMGSGIEKVAEQLAATGIKVHVYDHDALKYFNDESYANIAAAEIEANKPDLVLGSATFYGKALLSRLAALCNGGMASDSTGLAVEDGAVVATRPCYGGNVFTKVKNSSDGPFFVTLRPNAFSPAESGDGGVVEKKDVNEESLSKRTEIAERVAQSGERVNLTEAEIIVSGGRGIRGPENFRLIEGMAKPLGAAVGASRAIVDAGWVEYSYQVGQTGKTVSPNLYFAVGISGAIQHLVGMQSSKIIVAINRDKDAPIFNIATYGIVGDLFEVVPVLTKKLEALKA